jgi:hypothetical protein
LVNHREKTLVTILGDVRVKSSYYHCRHCGVGFKPWEVKSGIGPRRLTPGAEESLTLAGTLTSFAKAAEKVLPKLAGIRVAESTVERTTEDAGARVAERLASHETFGDAREWEWSTDAQGRTCGYVELDYVSVPQQGPGGAKAESRMAAVALVADLPSQEKKAPHVGVARPNPGELVRYLAGFYSLDDLGLTLRRQAAQVGWDQLQQQVALSDAGAGLEDFFRKSFPRAERVLDLYHVCQHVASMASACHPRDEAAARCLAGTWRQRLKPEGGAAVREAWRELSLRGWNAARKETYRRELGYFDNHAHRMDYPRYVAAGWHIGSGAVESACKRLVTQRLKGPGMRWSEQGSHALCHLTALFHSEDSQWDSFWLPRRPPLHLQM